MSEQSFDEGKGPKESTTSNDNLDLPNRFRHEAVPEARKSDFSYELHGQIIHDPYQWLEQTSSPEVDSFVDAQNLRTNARYREGELFEELKQELKKRNTELSFYMPSFNEEIAIRIRSTPEHPKGTLEFCSLAEFEKNGINAEYEQILSYDELAAAEGRDWLSKGQSFNGKRPDRFIQALSDGGTDAVVTREYDLKTRTCLDSSEAFVVEGKVRFQYFGDSHDVIFGLPDKEHNTSSSGYPLEVRYWDRTGPVEEAAILYKADASHMSANGGSLEIEEGEYRIVIFDSIDFFHKQVFILTEDKQELIQLPLPEQFDWFSCKDGVLFYRPNEAYEVAGVDASGSIVALDLKTFLDTGEIHQRLVFAAPENGTIEDARYTEGMLYVNYLHNVTSRVACVEFQREQCASEQGVLSFTEIPLPGLGDVTFGQQKNKAGFYLWYNDFVTPSTLYFIPSGEKQLGQPVFQYPHKFDSSHVEVSQEWASSKDGTQVPFFVLDGRIDKSATAPTVIDAYGGFGISLGPAYDWGSGACWLEKGGIYVIANLRGGGEFGPDWHEQGKFAGRGKVYEDCIAVGNRLVELGLTLPQQLGITGGSNGGLLTGNMLVRAPELFGAIAIGVPLLDMLRYDQLLAGDSWTPEYGSPKRAEDIPALQAMSAYHNVDPDRDYPATLITTSRTDDRVAPGHARKMAALLHEHDNRRVYFHENTDKGHNSSDFNNWIPEAAMKFGFFWQELK